MSAFRICAERFANGDADEELRLMSMQLIDQDSDYCFAKCLWTESKQYNEETNSINVRDIIQELTNKGYDVPQHLRDLEGPTDGSCKVLFVKTRRFIQNEFLNQSEQ